MGWDGMGQARTAMKWFRTEKYVQWISLAILVYIRVSNRVLLALLEAVVLVAPIRKSAITIVQMQITMK